MLDHKAISSTSLVRGGIGRSSLSALPESGLASSCTGLARQPQLLWVSKCAHYIMSRRQCFQCCFSFYKFYSWEFQTSIQWNMIIFKPIFSYNFTHPSDSTCLFIFSKALSPVRAALLRDCGACTEMWGSCQWPLLREQQLSRPQQCQLAPLYFSEFTYEKKRNEHFAFQLISPWNSTQLWESLCLSRDFCTYIVLSCPHKLQATALPTSSH